MKTKLTFKFFSLIILTLFFGLFSAKTAYAANFQLSGKVTDGSNSPIVNTAVTVTDPNSQATVGTATTDTNGNYSLSVPQGIYNVTAAPPSSSGFQNVTVNNQTISADTVLNFTLVPIPPPPVTLSGHITDRTGAAVAGITVSAGMGQTTTDNNGFYSVQVQPAPNDFITLTGGGGSNLPGSYSIQSNNGSTPLNITKDTTLDIQLTADLVTVQAQDPSQLPIANANVLIEAQNGAEFSAQTSLGSLTFTSATDGNTAQSSGTTDSSGKVTLPMFPTQTSISVTPPAGSNLQDNSVQQTITHDTTVTISLESIPSNVTLSGHITDKTGAAVAGLTVSGQTTTDNNGFYSVQIASGGDVLTLTGGGGSNLPSSFSMQTVVNVTQNSTLDMQLPSDLINVHVQDPSQSPVAGAGVNIKFNLDSSLAIQTSLGVLQFHSSTDNSLAFSHGQTDNSGNVTLPMFPGTVNIEVDPPTNSLLNNSVTQSITQDTSVTVTLDNNNTPNAHVTVSGHVTDRTGAGVAGVTISIGGGTATTDSNGFYSLQSLATAEPIFIQSGGAAKFPSFNLGSNGVNLTQDITIDIHLPGNLVTVYVQGPSQQPVANAAVNICSQSNSVSIQTSLGTLQFGANGDFQCLASATGQTNTSGEITLPIFSGTANIAVNPPTGSNLISASTQLTITGDTTQVFSLQSNNKPPAVGTITVSPNPVQINTAITGSAPFTDPNATDTHTASWNWGDGNTTTGTVTESNGSGSVNGSHQYLSTGVYVIKLTITDNNGGQGTQTFQYVSVYNPTAQGLFSAGQKYTSPAGAYAQNTSLTGTVLFGLSYKYQGSVPVGNREFSMDFNAANFHFNATTVSSLVIANGMGTLTGTGTINGSGTYNFLVTGNASANTIRIQIKDSSGNVVYDTQPGASDTATPTTAVTGNVLAH